MDNRNTPVSFTYVEQIQTPRKGPARNNIKRMTTDELCKWTDGKLEGVPRTLCEFIEGNPRVRPYYDWDRMPSRSTEEAAKDAKLFKANEKEPGGRGWLPQWLLDLEEEDQADFEACLCTLHPGLAKHEDDIAFASRSSWKPSKGGFVVSLRAFVQGQAMNVTDVLRNINAAYPHGKKPNALDVSIYKGEEQLMALVGGYKGQKDKKTGLVDKRVLTPLTEQHSPEAFICQLISQCTDAATHSRFTQYAGSPTRERQRVALDASSSATCVEAQALESWLQITFGIPLGRVCLSNVDRTRQAGRVWIPTRWHGCPYYGRPHGEQHAFVNLTPTMVYLGCYDDACRNKKQMMALRSSAPSAVQSQLSDFLSASAMSLKGIDEVCKEATPFIRALNKTFNLDEDEKWIVVRVGIPGKKTDAYEYKTRSSTRCFVHGCKNNGHDVPSICAIRIYDVANQVTVRCCRLDGNGEAHLPTPRAVLLEAHRGAVACASIEKPAGAWKEARPLVLLTDFLAAHALQEGLRRDSTHVYKPHPNARHSYVRYLDHQSYLHSVFAVLRREHPIARHYRCGNHPKLMDFLEKTGDPDLPFLEPNRSFVGVRNGIIEMGSQCGPQGCAFHPYTDETTMASFPAGFTVSRYLDSDLDEFHLDTPAFDAVVLYQFKPDIAELLLAFMGRIMFPIGTDQHAVMLYLYGLTRTGKSAVLKAIKAWFRGKFATIEKGLEAVFAFGGQFGLPGLIIEEFPTSIRNIWDVDSFKSMITGSEILSKKKGKQTVASEPWTLPIAAAGNVLPDWPNKNNSVAVRLAIFHFARKVQDGKSDATFELDIPGKEAANILWKALKAYKVLLFDRKTTPWFDAVWKPAYFDETARLYREASDPILPFFHGPPEERLEPESPFVAERFMYEIEYGPNLFEDINLVLRVFRDWATIKQQSFKLAKTDGIWSTVGLTCTNTINERKNFPCPGPPPGKERCPCGKLKAHRDRRHAVLGMRFRKVPYVEHDQDQDVNEE
ncbi:hypothetical protein HKX48_000301 [Thoreauomyces humboldtii]|nr:hypothetical protein HKX48_000301 [Thoreauomyces humboldtii]